MNKTFYSRVLIVHGHPNASCKIKLLYTKGEYTPLRERNIVEKVNAFVDTQVSKLLKTQCRIPLK